jgi:iron complex transport system substrate-binding protein
VSVIDDTGRTVTLPHPAQRVLTLSPNTTELLFEAGGGSRIVGTVAYSDYPPAARKIPRVGDNTAFDLERIVALKPDLAIAWRHADAQSQLPLLSKLGIPVYYSDPRRLNDVPSTLERLGILVGSSAHAQQAASAYQQRLTSLRQRYANRSEVLMFYQVWQQPLMTLNGTHLVSDVMSVCGGRNLFANETLLVPTISTESVVASNPEVILTASMGATQSSTPLADLEHWKRWPALTAVQRQNLLTINGDLINRQGPRVLDAVQHLCEQLDEVRSRRPQRR